MSKATQHGPYRLEYDHAGYWRVYDTRKQATLMGPRLVASGPIDHCKGWVARHQDTTASTKGSTE